MNQQDALSRDGQLREFNQDVWIGAIVDTSTQGGRIVLADSPDSLCDATRPLTYSEHDRASPAVG